MAERRIFRTLRSVEEAYSILYEHWRPAPVGVEEAALADVYGRVLAEDIVSGLDVPGFDRSVMDGFAVRASDTFGADEKNSVALNLVGTSRMGEAPSLSVEKGQAVEVATGAPLPSGANSVVMVEHTERQEGLLRVFRPVVPGENVMAAGGDIMLGEVVVRRGTVLSPREVGVLAAVGRARVPVYRRPRVCIISTGDELVPPGRRLEYGRIFDINAHSLASAVREVGCDPVIMGIVGDDPEEMKRLIKKSLQIGDMTLTSGSTSAGAGDLVYRIIDGLGRPGVLVHGLTVKPGKPTVIAVVDGRPFVGLPGYPVSALMIFHLVVGPLLTAMAALPPEESVSKIDSVIATRIYSARGRRELLPVHVVKGDDGRWKVFPVESGSGAISSLGMSDGFLDIPAPREFLEEEEPVEVYLFGRTIRPASMVFIGSHCVGIDILSQVIRESHPSFSSKIVNVGSVGGIHAVRNGEADAAGVHLLDESTGAYNIQYVKRFGLGDRAVLIRGYGREQGLMLAKGNPKGISSLRDLLREDVRFINRNPGSGTRILLDLNLKGLASEQGESFDELRRRIRGYDLEARSHSAVAAAVASGKADAGVGIRTSAFHYDLDFVHLSDESYDFLVPKSRLKKEEVQIFLEALSSSKFAEELKRRAPGLVALPDTGTIVPLA